MHSFINMEVFNFYQIYVMTMIGELQLEKITMFELYYPHIIRVFMFQKIGHIVKFKSKNAVTGINEVKIWSYSVDGGRNWSEYEAVTDLNFTNAKPKVSYTTDGHGDLSKTEELVAVNGNPTGVTNTPKAGYIFKNYVANKNVTLKAGTVINAGKAITEEPIPQIVITDDITIQAVHEKKVDLATNDGFEVNTPASKTYDV